MFAVGHFALGYLVGKFFGIFLDVPVSLPLLFLASVFPDTDILFSFLEHRGPLHSILFCCIVFIPLFWIYQKKAFPYFVAVIQHSLIGDFLTGGSQLLWPFSLDFYGLDIGIRSTINISLEWVLFVFAVVVMVKSRDLKKILSPNFVNFILLIPLMTVLLPIIVDFPLYIPMFLILPHVFFIGVFVFSLFVTLKDFQN